MSKGTPMRYIRIDNELWTEFKTEAKTAGLNASEVIRVLVREWLETNKQGGEMSEQDDLAMELFIGDNFNQPRESSIQDWEYFHAEQRFTGRVEHYQTMAAHALTIGYRKVQK